MFKRTILFLAAALLLSACAGNAPVPTVTPTLTPEPATATSTATLQPTETATPTITLTPTPEIVEIDVGPNNFPEEVNPLTGLVPEDPTLLDRRPVAAKIQLFPRYGRPPLGLNTADIVWEYYHNGGITRLFALFYGQDAAEIGPIRSARLPDNDLIQMYKSIFAYGSADRRINQRLFNAPYEPYLVLEGVTTLCPPTAEHPMCRFDPNGQNLLLSGTAELTQYIIDEGLTNTRQDLTGLRFTSALPEDGQAVNQIFFRYSADSYARWDYDLDTGLYVRYQDTRFDDGTGEEYEVLTDRNTEEPVTTSNVVVVQAEHGYFFRSGASEIVEINLEGTGTAYLFRDGEMYEVTWSRPTLDAQLTIVDAQGNAFPLKPGTTWFQVVGTSSEITQPEDGVYRFESHIP